MILRIVISMALLLVLCAADFPEFARPGPPPSTIELAQGWSLSSARDLPAGGAALSRTDYRGSAWHQINRMPSTVLQTLQNDGTYPNLYVGTNLLDVPQDLYKQDWWYRTTFTAPAGHSTYVLEFPGINYRAEIWLNGHLIADNKHIVGMHNAHELDVSRWVNPGGSNALAVKVTPEQAIQDVDGVELADSWYDWINWNRIGYQGPGKNPNNGNSFVPDRNAGIWKPVYLRVSGAVVIGQSSVNTELPLATNRFREADDLQQSAQRIGATGSWCPSRDDHPARQARHPDRATGQPRGGGGTRGEFRPGPVRRAHRERSRPVVAVHDGGAQPLRPEAGVPPVRRADRFQRPQIRHPHHLAASRLRSAVPGTGQGRQLLSQGQRQGLPGPRCRIHPRPVVRRRPRTRCGDHALRKGSRAQHDSAGGKVPRRQNRGDGRRDGHPADVRLDVLQPMGEVVPMG